MQDIRGMVMTEGNVGKSKPSALHAMRAVLWSFIGIRSKSEYQADITRLTMGQIIVAGVIGAILFVMTLLLVVYFVTK
jgi:hypothetical protein